MQPTLVAHADWSAHSSRRWIARAPEKVGEPRTPWPTSTKCTSRIGAGAAGGVGDGTGGAGVGVAVAGAVAVAVGVVGVSVGIAVAASAGVVVGVGAQALSSSTRAPRIRNRFALMARTS
ncbi:MAG: hypothetical protein ACUVWR_17280 [Anaerolineae bacterium]